MLNFQRIDICIGFFSGNSKHDKVISDEVTVFGSLPRLFCYVLHKRFICNSLAGYSWHGQRYDRPVQRQIQPSSLLWEVKGGRAKGKSLEADRINRHPDNIRIRIGKHCRFICDPDFTSEADSSCYMVKIIEKKSFNARRNLITACWSCLSTFFCGMPNCSAISL